MKLTEAAKTFKVGLRSINNWKKLKKETGSLHPKSGYQNGHSHAIMDIDLFMEFVQKTFNCSEADSKKRKEYLEAIKSIDLTNIVYCDKTGIDDN